MYRLQAIVREHRDEFEKTCTELANTYVEKAMAALKEFFETHPGMTDYEVFSVPISNINFATKEITICNIDDIFTYKHEEYYDTVLSLLDKKEVIYADALDYYDDNYAPAFNSTLKPGATKLLSESFVSARDVMPFAAQLTKMGFQPFWFLYDDGFERLYPFFFA